MGEPGKGRNGGCSLWFCLMPLVFESQKAKKSNLLLKAHIFEAVTLLQARHGEAAEAPGHQDPRWRYTPTPHAAWPKMAAYAKSQGSAHVFGETMEGSHGFCNMVRPFCRLTRCHEWSCRASGLGPKLTAHSDLWNCCDGTSTSAVHTPIFGTKNGVNMGKQRTITSTSINSYLHLLPNPLCYLLLRSISPTSSKLFQRLPQATPGSNYPSHQAMQKSMRCRGIQGLGQSHAARLWWSSIDPSGAADDGMSSQSLHDPVLHCWRWWDGVFLGGRFGVYVCFAKFLKILKNKTLKKKLQDNPECACYVLLELSQSSEPFNVDCSTLFNQLILWICPTQKKSHNPN